jgi:hypothetical protein
MSELNIFEVERPESTARLFLKVASWNFPSLFPFLHGESTYLLMILSRCCTHIIKEENKL